MKRPTLKDYQTYVHIYKNIDHIVVKVDTDEEYIINSYCLDFANRFYEYLILGKRFKRPSTMVYYYRITKKIAYEILLSHSQYIAIFKKINKIK